METQLDMAEISETRAHTQLMVLVHKKGTKPKMGFNDFCRLWISKSNTQHNNTKTLKNNVKKTKIDLFVLPPESDSETQLLSVAHQNRNTKASITKKQRKLFQRNFYY